MPELAWHFVRDGTQLCVGEWLEHDGLHASTRALDALHYAPGVIVCRVAIDGEIERGDNKLVCSRSLPLWAFDASDVLRRFASECALSVINLWDAPDVVREYLETGNKSLRAAAECAARAAARAFSARATRAAAWAAWGDAAQAAAAACAAEAATWAAWGDAALAAAAECAALAAAAAWAAAARDAAPARAEQNALLESLLDAAAATRGCEICPAVLRTT